MNDVSLVAATVQRTTTGSLSVAVAGMELGEERQLADALSKLCHYAIHAQVTLVVTVQTGAGKKYMVVDETGYVTPAAAPAPTRDDYVPVNIDFPRTLGTAESDPYTTAEWVERHVFDPNADRPDGPPRKRRKWFWGD